MHACMNSHRRGNENPEWPVLLKATLGAPVCTCPGAQAMSHTDHWRRTSRIPVHTLDGRNMALLTLTVYFKNVLLISFFKISYTRILMGA